MNFKHSIYLSLFLVLRLGQFTFGQSEAISSLKFLSVYEVPFNKHFKNTTIGGLSGIDYDEKNETYYLICDDRSSINPARYYTAKLFITEKGIDSIQFLSVQYLFLPDGNTYPNFKTDPMHTPDPESIRYNPKTTQVIWSNEGERTKHREAFILQDPAIILSDPSGKYQSELPIPSNIAMHENELGSRQNGTLEGLSFSSDYETLYASMEEPLYQDGSRADIVTNDAIARIYQYDFVAKKNVAQYAYPLETVAFTPTPPTAFKVNGISEILTLENNKLLVVERSFSWGRLACTVKVFIADLTKADNVAGVASLRETPTAHVAEKRLLLNMDAIGIYIDNVEGVTLGPRLSNGHQTLVFVTDNNFSALEKTQFLLFEVIP